MRIVATRLRLSILGAGLIGYKSVNCDFQVNVYEGAKGIVRPEPMSQLEPVQRVINEPLAEQSWLDTPILKTMIFEWAQEATGESIIG